MLLALFLLASVGSSTDEIAPSYRGLDEVGDRLHDWARAHPEHAEPFVLGASARGVEAPALSFGGPGPRPLRERPVILLVGGLDGVSLAGAEAVLAAVGGLLDEVDALPPEVAFVAVPWAAPEGLENTRSGRSRGGTNGTPDDLDGDGRSDEDPPDDVDGDGAISTMLVERPDGAFALSADRRFLRRAGPLDAPRYALVPEGRDDDGDGRFNEDGPGGVVLDRNFPLGWEPRCEAAQHGDWPLSEPLARALADLVLERRTLAVLIFQGAHGRVAWPGADATTAVRECDRGLFEEWSERARSTLGLPERAAVSLFELGVSRSGAAADWTYAAAGALSLELALWGPRVALPGTEIAVDAPDDRLWMRWVEDVHGGIGFSDWAPVELDGGVRGYVGGFGARTRLNPPARELPRITRGAADFVRELADARPRVAFEVLETERRGSFCRLRARVRNEGELPTGLAPEGSWGRDGARLVFELPADARLVAGEEHVDLPHLAGGGVSRELEWYFTLPEGAAVTLEFSDDWCAPRREAVEL